MEGIERLSRMEVEVEVLKESFAKVETALTQLANDMHTLAVTNAERKQDRETIDRIFSELSNIRNDQKSIWQRLKDIEDVHADYVNAQLKHQLNERNRLIRFALTNGATLLIAFILYHFGIKIL